MNKLLLFIVIIVLVVGGIWYFANQTESPNTQDPDISFDQDGNLVYNNPGLKPDTWHLVYELPGAPAVTHELDLEGQSFDLRPGMRVRVQGHEQDQVVRVESLTILNANKDDLIWLDSPLPNAAVSSPLIVTGEARGGWYFEADFSVTLLDSNGAVLALTPATAQGEWMTSDYVPFSATLNFSAPAAGTGTLVLEKSNPSGLPENADELRVPVRFESSQQNAVRLYYYNPAQDRDASGNIQCSRQGLVEVQRQVPITNTPIQDTVNLLLQGNLTAQEQAQGIETEFPLPGLQLEGANLANGNLTLEFDDPQNQTSGGSCRAGILWFQIEATALQFDSVTSVDFIPEELFQP